MLLPLQSLAPYDSSGSCATACAAFKLASCGFLRAGEYAPKKYSPNDPKCLKISNLVFADFLWAATCALPSIFER